MKTHPTSPTRTVVSLSASLLLFTATNHWAACGPGTPTISGVPSLGGSLYRVKALNANGQVAGWSYVSGDLEVHAFRSGPGGLVDLGTLGGTSSQGFTLNNAGQIAGESTLSGDLASRGFLHDGTSMLDLGTLGGSYSTATSINDAGQVVGSSQTSGDAGLEAFLYKNGDMLSLGHLGGGYSTAAAINQTGKVVGSSLTAASEFHGFLYSSGVMVDLGSLGGGYSAANALNGSAVVVGDSSLATGETHGFVYAAGIMTDLGTLGGTSSSASGINNVGQIIGTAATAEDAQILGFIFNGSAMTSLGTLGGNYSTPHAINDLGQVVGETETAEFVMRAFLWQSGSMIDLNTLLTAGSGWELNSAQFINNAGRIVGQGTLNGEPQWFILDLGSANNPPVANAGVDQTAQCSGQVTLDGTLSSDPDGDALTYEWTDGSVMLGNSATLTATFGPGTHTVTLKVSDPCGDFAQDTVVVQVVGDTTPPTIACPSTVARGGSGDCETIVPDLRPLVLVSDNCTPANALVVTQDPAPGTVLGSGQYTITVTVTDASGNSASCTSTMTVGDTKPPVIVRLPSCVTVSTGRDCEGEVPSLKGQVVAKDNCTPAKALVITQSPAAGTLLPKGEQLITVTVTDAAGNSTSKHVNLRVVDRTAPKIHSVTATPNVLSPADGKPVRVNVSVVATDNCDSAPSFKIVKVLCDERTDDGDIRILSDLSVRLAASRSSRGDGRTYRIVILCRDSSGNCTFDSVTVRVPRTSGRH
jgi:probable HAF family extracellular repeat protein